MQCRIAQLVHTIATKFQRLYSCFRGRATRRDKWEYCPMSECVVNQSQRLLTGSRNVITCISASMHDSNETPTALPNFSRSGYTIRLLMRRQPDVWICEESKMAHINFQLKISGLIGRKKLQRPLTPLSLVRYFKFLMLAC